MLRIGPTVNAASAAASSHFATSMGKYSRTAVAAAAAVVPHIAFDHVEPIDELGKKVFEKSYKYWIIKCLDIVGKCFVFQKYINITVVLGGAASSACVDFELVFEAWFVVPVPALLLVPVQLSVPSVAAHLWVAE